MHDSTGPHNINSIDFRINVLESMRKLTNFTNWKYIYLLKYFADLKLCLCMFNKKSYFCTKIKYIHL